ncbi:hypothetical protein D5085_17320 [Ectothiorhodospiraceae bacterium BW-2]|nr:hypothetical protein D5085_17320 [Ectothiorhodospiraceae bacterium BW-2]
MPPPLFDQNEALARAGHNATLTAELFTMFQADLPEYRREIAAFNRHTPLAPFVNTIHKLLGATRYCGFLALQQLVTECDEALKSGKADRFLSLREPLLTQIDAVLALKSPFTTATGS